MSPRCVCRGCVHSQEPFGDSYQQTALVSYRADGQLPCCVFPWRNLLISAPFLKFDRLLSAARADVDREKDRSQSVNVVDDA